MTEPGKHPQKTQQIPSEVGSTSGYLLFTDEGEFIISADGFYISAGGNLSGRHPQTAGVDTFSVGQTVVESGLITETHVSQSSVANATTNPADSPTSTNVVPVTIDSTIVTPGQYPGSGGYTPKG